MWNWTTESLNNQFHRNAPKKKQYFNPGSPTQSIQLRDHVDFSNREE